MLTEIVVFGIGYIFGVLTVITWALCAADKRRGDDDDTSDL